MIVTLASILGDVLTIHVLHYGCKPLIMGLLLLFVWQYQQAVGFTGYIKWLLAGMVFAMLGDILLMIREVDLFVGGLGAFLVMQLCYSIAFVQSIRMQGDTFPTSRLWRSTIPFGLYLLVFLLVLHPALTAKPASQALWPPVVVYGICLTTMGLLAAQRIGLAGYHPVLQGALLFILSDSAIAVNRFLYPFAGSTWVVMSTYAAAQYLITIGMIQGSLKSERMKE